LQCLERIAVSNEGVLQGKRVLITGGTGQIGWGVAHAAADAGAQLVLTTRSEGSAERLRAEFADASVLTVDLTTADASAALASAIAEVEGIDHVVAPMGSWWQRGPTIDQDPAELSELLDTYATGQHRLLTATAGPLSDAGGSYTMVTGAAGEALLPGTGLLVVAVRAQYALADVLRQELADAPFRFNEFRINTRIERDPRPGVTTSVVAGHAFVALMTSTTRSSRVDYPATRVTI
jgi:NAD(P)-dependent dehydrogenase (short-subunit alcohol dehydrogenase family)